MRSVLGVILSSAWLLAADAPKPTLQQIHSVYLLPMGNSLDQYLANRLTATGVFQVVTDPQKADAVVSDNIGKGLELKLEELYPTAPPPPKKEEGEDKLGDAMGKPANRFGSFSRGRGTVFIVDRGTRSVVWSIYMPVKTSRPDDTDRRAGEIVKRLEKQIKGK